MKKLHIDRLKKIAHLMKRKKVSKKISYNSHWICCVSKIHREFDNNKIGVDGFPLIFPKKYRFEVMEFLGISARECSHLFYPNRQLKKYGGKLLSDHATKAEVTNNLLTFIKCKQRKGK